MQQSTSPRIRAGRRSENPASLSSAAPDAAANTEPASMTIFRIRLIERITSQGSADFQVEARSAEEAAAVVAKAQLQAYIGGSNLVTLPDGQVQVVEPDSEVGRETQVILLDEDGVEVRHFTVPK